MSRPGVETYSAATAPATGVPTDTSVLFLVGEAAQGPVNIPTRITSLTEFETTFGDRVAGSYTYDSLDAFFGEQGGQCYMQRMADGASSATAAADALFDGATGVTATAGSEGSWGNALELDIASTPGGTTQSTKSAESSSKSGKSKAKNGAPARSSLLTFPDAEQQAGPTFMATVKQAGKIVQTSTPIQTSDELTAFLGNKAYVRVTGAPPGTALVAGTVSLTGGADGTVPVDELGALLDALDAIPKTLGPGQIIAPGRADPDSQAALLAHCAKVGHRVAILDGAVDQGAEELTSAAALIRGAEEDRYGSLWGPWAVIPGLASGTTRQVPWSPVQAALCARNDQAGNPNQAAAGQWGECQYVVDLVQSFTESECEDLLYAGVDTARSVYGSIQAYAFRTLVDPAGPRADWLEFNWARLNMAIVAESERVGQGYTFSQLDGRGHTIAAYNGELAGMLGGYYDIDALFGDDVTDAFVVNTGPAVNPVENLADGILAAVLSVRMSPHAELVKIYIVKRPITVALTA